MVTGVETWAEFVQKVYQAYDKFVNDAIYQALKTDAAALSAPFKGTGALSEATLLALCEAVSMATGYDVVIMGTKTALSKVVALQGTNWISQTMKDEKNRTGLIRYWEGIELVELKQGFQRNDITNKLLDDDHLFIMPKTPSKFIKLVYEGEALVNEVTDRNANMDMTYEYEVMEKMGVGVVANLQYGFWDI